MVFQVEELKELILDVLKNYDVKRASVFGSIAKGEATDESDIDLLVEFEGKKSLLDLVGLKLDLQDLLHCKVDILTYNSINPLLKEIILNEQVVIL